MTHDTSKLAPDEWRSTIQPAEACSGIGEDYEDALPEGAAIVTLLIAVIAVLSCAMLVHLLTSYL